MKFSVGQTIVGRRTGRYNPGEVKVFTIVKVGAKYIYVKESDCSYLEHTTPLHKDTLANKDWTNDKYWEYFPSEKAMEDHDEAMKLVMEIRRIAESYHLEKVDLENLRKIRALLENAV